MCSLRSIMGYLWGCTTEANLDRIQRIQNLLTRIMCNNFDYINFRGIEMVRTLRLQSIREMRDYFLCILMFKCIHGFAPHYLCNDVTMYIDISGYDTRSAENMDLYLPRCSRESYKKKFPIQRQFPLESITAMLEGIYIDCWFQTLLQTVIWLKTFWAFVCTFYISYVTSSCWKRMMFVFQLVIFIFIWHSFLSYLLYEVYLYMIYIYVCIYVSFVCIFYSVTGHHGKTVWLNGPPCINIFEIKKNIADPWVGSTMTNHNTELRMTKLN